MSRNTRLRRDLDSAFSTVDSAFDAVLRTLERMEQCNAEMTAALNRLESAARPVPRYRRRRRDAS